MACRAKLVFALRFATTNTGEGKLRPYKTNAIRSRRGVITAAASLMDFPFNIPAPCPVSEVDGRALPARSGVDRETFDRMVLEQLPAAQRFAIRLTGNPDDAEDVMQD